MNDLCKLVHIILEQERSKKNLEHLVKTGIDLIVDQFVEHASKESDRPDEEIKSASVELKRTFEAVYVDMYDRLRNGEFSVKFVR